MPIRIMKPGEKVLDWSWSRPLLSDVAAISSGAIRYIGWDPIDSDDGDKVISKAEALNIVNAGLGLALVFETIATRPLAGGAAGHADALTAVRHAQNMGYEGVIFAAVDFDAVPTMVMPYLQEFCAQVELYGYASGLYGSYRLVEHAALYLFGTYFWQTEAWSYGAESSHAHLIQRIGVDLEGTDTNDILKPVPFWTNKSNPINIPGVDEMLYLVQLLSKQIVLTDGFRGRLLFDDGSEYDALLNVVKLPLISVVDPHVNNFYRNMVGLEMEPVQ